MNKSIYRRKTEAFPLSTKVAFFFFIRPLPFSFCNIFHFAYYILCPPASIYLFQLFPSPFFMFFSCWIWLFLALHIVTFVKLLKLTPSSYRWNMVLLWSAPGI